MQKAQETCETLVEEYERPKVVTYGERRDDLAPGLTCTWVSCSSTTHGTVYSYTNP